VTKTIPISKLKNDDEYVIRPLNEDAINRYVDLFKAGKQKSIKIQKGTNLIVDGYHRVEAAKRLGLEKIKANVIDIPDNEIRSQAFKANKNHGVPLTREERDELIVKLYHKDGKTPQQIADIIELTDRWIREILSQAEVVPKSDNGVFKENQAKKDLHLPTVARLIINGEKQENIASKFGVSQSTISDKWGKFRDKIYSQYVEEKLLKKEIAEKVDLSIDEIDKILQEYGDPLNFDLEIRTLWPAFGLDDRFGKEHASNLPALLIKNILALYTKPGDVILDPAAGGGVVLDAAKDMVNRTAYLYDLTPKRKDIKTNNLLTGPPNTPKPPDLVFLDLPYGPMLKDKYSEDPNDLANIPLEKFYDALEIIFNYWDQCKIVVLMSSWKNDGVVYDLPYETEKRLIFTPLYNKSSNVE